MKNYILIFTFCFVFSNCLGGGNSSIQENNQGTGAPDLQVGLEFLPSGETNSALYGLWKTYYTITDTNCTYGNSFNAEAFQAKIGVESTNRLDYDRVFGGNQCSRNNGGEHIEDGTCNHALNTVAWTTIPGTTVLDDCMMSSSERALVEYSSETDQLTGEFIVEKTYTGSCDIETTNAENCYYRGSLRLVRYTEPTSEEPSEPIEEPETPEVEEPVVLAETETVRIDSVSRTTNTISVTYSIDNPTDTTKRYAVRSILKKRETITDQPDVTNPQTFRCPILRSAPMYDYCSRSNLEAIDVQSGQRYSQTVEMEIPGYFSNTSESTYDLMLRIYSPSETSRRSNFIDASDLYQIQVPVDSAL